MGPAAVGVATTTSTALADALDDTPVFTGCRDRIACRLGRRRPD
ncbi:MULTISPECIES: hypothetical protein [Streptomyces]|nr:MULTISPECIES: hypothetical protein [Streptomyces]MDI5904268.1 hypothetical protein [Streptomyces sp. 12257]